MLIAAVAPSLPQGHEVNRVVNATYTVSGRELTMHWKGAGWTKGILKDNTFTMNNEGMIFSTGNNQSPGTFIPGCYYSIFQGLILAGLGQSTGIFV